VSLCLCGKAFFLFASLKDPDPVSGDAVPPTIARSYGSSRAIIEALADRDLVDTRLTKSVQRPPLALARKQVRGGSGRI